MSMNPSLDSDGYALAVQTRDMHKFYGSGKNASHVLRGVSIDVPYGSIYGLLGASGCGKTTLLRCMLGRLPIHSGRITILGKHPGTKGHGVPGNNLGYMPQEPALINEFTLMELFYYFALLYHMNLSYTCKRVEMLKAFLGLPSLTRKCGILSGDQKRRISLAVALLHEPPLLILDEPTVGLDPLLRAKIWRHLLEIAASGETTIVLTTHYIEEARQAHTVGLMRTGRLLAQSKPNDLIRAFNVSTLEDVFLKLAEEEEISRQKSRASKSVTVTGYASPEPQEHTPLLPGAFDYIDDPIGPPSFLQFPKLELPRLPKPYNMLALIWKQLLKFFRHPIMLFLLLISPMIQMSMYCFGYGRAVDDLKIFVTNYDTDEADFPFLLGERFISYINEDTLDLKFTNDSSEGLKEVQDGKAYGHVVIPPRYTENFLNWNVRVCNKIMNFSIDVNLTEKFLNSATIQVAMDVSNQQIYHTINRTLSNAFQAVLRDILNATGAPNYLDHPLLNISRYVLGKEDLEFADAVYTAMLGAIVIGLSMTLTATQLIMERKDGITERIWAAGVNATEVVLSQMLAFLIILLTQITPLFFLITYAFDLPREGTLPIAYLLILGEGMVGIAFGLMLSALLDSEVFALQVAFGVYIPVVIVGGVLWPIESIPKWMHTISKIFPVAVPTKAITSIFIRGIQGVLFGGVFVVPLLISYYNLRAIGWGLDKEVVWLGFIIIVSWLLSLMIATGIGIHVKK